MMSTDVNSLLELLTDRVSHSALGLPGPTPDQITDIVRAGMRAPDHGLLRPWYFVVIEGDRREQLGTVLQNSLRLRGVTDESQLAKALKAPERAPTIIAVMLQFKNHPKVERNEQIGSAAAAAYAMSLASNALGFGSMWRTGVYATDPSVVAALGGGVQDEVIGFLYLGTREGPSKKLPVLDPAEFMTHF